MSTSLPVVSSSGEALPTLYATWVNELLGAPIPRESAATCHDCAMCQPGQAAPAESGFFFDAASKCCTYIPALPNFLVGLALADDDPAAAAGRASLERRMDSGVAVTPLGVGRHPDEESRYSRLTQHVGFGRMPGYRCPHYQEDGGACGIWRYRNAVCATWFCKHVRGLHGFVFWRTLQTLLSQVELALAAWCLRELDLPLESLRLLLPVPGAPEPAALDAGKVDGVLRPQVRKAMWGPWLGRECELYAACGARVAALRWADVERIAGPAVELYAKLTRDAFARLLHSQTPARLRQSSFVVLSATPERIRLGGYSGTDPLDIPRPVFDVLHYFDGRPVPEVLADIETRGGVRLGEDLVRKLWDFGLLSAAHAPE